MIWSNYEIEKELHKYGYELDKKGITGKEKKDLLKAKKESLEDETQKTKKWCDDFRSYLIVYGVKNID